MRYPMATWMPIPENYSQPRITPRLLILHSIIAPWEPERTGEFWKEPGIVTESHFGVGYSGAIGQYIDTAVRADANLDANNFAISVETASNTSGSDAWTDKQLDAIANLCVYAHVVDKIPMRIANAWNGSGFGYHRMYPQWAKGGATACPGTARVKQFHEELFPEIRRRANEEIPPFPGRQFFYIGAYNSFVTQLDNRLIAKGFAKHHDGDGYQAGPRFTEYTRLNVQDFQKAQGWSGADADGFPGPVTWQRLFS